jgi:Cu+-exporting ATPase
MSDNATQDSQPVTDPVCGMNIQPAKAAAHVLHDGRDLYFCSTDCRDKFGANPAQYVSAGKPSGLLAWLRRVFGGGCCSGKH